jgi:hypothetical protein
MSITVINYSLADGLVVGSRGGPQFSNTRITSSTGRKFINENYEFPIWHYTVELSEVTPEIVSAVRDLFMATRGGALGFLFKDPYDYTATAQPLVSGDHFRRYTIGGQNFDRLITRPDAGFSSGGGTWTGTFKIPVLIDTDALDLAYDILNTRAGIPSLPLVEILEGA